MLFLHFLNYVFTKHSITRDIIICTLYTILKKKLVLHTFIFILGDAHVGLLQKAAVVGASANMEKFFKANFKEATLSQIYLTVLL